MNDNATKIDLTGTPKAAEALKAFQDAKAERRLEHEQKAKENASAPKKPTV